MDTEVFTSIMKDKNEKIEKLEAENKRFRESLEFYADTSNWTHFKGESDFSFGRPIIKYNDCDHAYDNEWCSYGGKRARQALAGGGE